MATIPITDDEHPLLVTRNLQFHYNNHALSPTLNGIDLTLYPHDRVLLTGHSGSGKSTLAHVLTGLQSASDGVLLIHGFDPPTIGRKQWRKRIISVPQFHENHVFTASLAFNLLMGRCWPPASADLAAATTICHELGLDTLLEQMPRGLMQTIGEGGWQLSHGERSRLYIARALLQNANLIILDESFASLDPTNFEQALTCVLKRAPTLIVIAHP